MAILMVMLNDDIKASVEYLEYLAKSKGSNPVKTRGKGLLTKQGVKIVVERVSIPKRRRSETVVKEVGQSEEVVDEVDSDETEYDEEEPLVRRRPTGVVIGGEARKQSDEEGVDNSKKLKGIEMLSEAAQFKSNMKKALKASKDDFFIQYRPKCSGEGSGVTPEVPVELPQKGSNEGSDATPVVPDEPRDNSSSSSFEDEIEDIFSDEEDKGKDDKDKADESQKADEEITKTDRIDDDKAEEQIEDQGVNEQAGITQADVHVSDP
ncbi:hypothetical protein Tco_0153041 [Tanacetum coccineum]